MVPGAASEQAAARPSYQEDFVLWARWNAGLLDAGDFAAVDAANVAEEVRSVGISQSRELESRLVRLVHHLIKWQFQPERRSRSWRSTIDVQRKEIRRLLHASPSLRRAVEPSLPGVFVDALKEAESELEAALDVTSQELSYSAEQLLSDWMPE